MHTTNKVDVFEGLNIDMKNRTISGLYKPCFIHGISLDFFMERAVKDNLIINWVDFFTEASNNSKTVDDIKNQIIFGIYNCPEYPLSYRDICLIINDIISF